MKDLVMEVNASCNNTVISAIRKLEKMGLLKVNRENKNNRYYIENIEDFLMGTEKNTSVASFDINNSDYKNDENDDCEIDEIILKNKIARDMNCSLEEAVEALKYAKEKKAKSLIAYAKSTIKNGWHKIQSSYGSTMPNTNKKIGFANFTQRIYDYEKLEKQLLGWD